MFGIGDPVIKFKCFPDLYGKIPEPYPARHYIPDWYKKLEMFFFREEDGGAKRRIPTIKRCPPVLDALVTGWIIPLAADVEFTIRDGGAGVSWICGDNMNGDFIVEHHTVDQLSSHPNSPKVPLKFMNHWSIETPPGWSCLFTPPMNRPENNIELISGIVDTDKFCEYINFPGHLKQNDGYLRLEQGYPLMQVIPFKRGFNKTAKISAMTEKDVKNLKNHRDTRDKHPSLYRDRLWEKK